jgi:DNA processing protein
MPTIIPLRQWLLLTALFQSACSPDDDGAAELASHKQQARTLWRRYQEQPELCGFFAQLHERDYPDALRHQVDRCEHWCMQNDHHVLTRASVDYPPLLAAIPDTPPLLFVRGNPDVLCMPQIAIVGSRKPSSAGKRTATRFARELSGAGYLVTSGLALGIDAASHEGALLGSGRTIAVLGTGLDQIYPERHAPLAAAICEQGALVSELLPDSGPLGWHFPRRNRIISGLSHGVLVVEAALSSGSLITARMAAEQGREIFAVPGPIDSPQSRGCHRLLRQGATLVEEVGDILAETGGLLAWEQGRCSKASGNDSAPLPADTASANILAQIAYNPVSVDELAASLTLDVSELLPRLLQLELAGWLECHAGSYVRSGGSHAAERTAAGKAHAR